MSHREHDSAFVLLQFVVPTPNFWEVTYVHQCGKVDILIFSLHLNQIPCWDRVELFPFLVHGSFCVWNLHCLWHRDKLVHQFEICHRRKSFSSNALLMASRLQRFCLLSRGFMRLVLDFFSLLIFGFAITFVMLGWFLLHGMAGATGLSIFSSDFWEYPHIPCRSDQWHKFLSVFEQCRVSVFLLHSCFSRFWAAFTIFVQNYCPYMIWSGSRLNLCQFLPDHIYPFGGFSFEKSELCESSPRIWQMSARIDIPEIVNSYFMHDVQISMSRPSFINKFQWNRECFFLRHIDLNSRFIVMAIDKVSLHRPKIGTSFSVICWFGRLRPFRFALKFSTEIVTPYSRFLP